MVALQLCILHADIQTNPLLSPHSQLEGREKNFTPSLWPHKYITLGCPWSNIQTRKTQHFNYYWHRYINKIIICLWLLFIDGRDLKKWSPLVTRPSINFYFPSVLPCLSPVLDLSCPRDVSNCPFCLWLPLLMSLCSPSTVLGLPLGP